MDEELTIDTLKIKDSSNGNFGCMAYGSNKSGRLIYRDKRIDYGCGKDNEVEFNWASSSGIYDILNFIVSLSGVIRLLLCRNIVISDITIVCKNVEYKILVDIKTIKYNSDRYYSLYEGALYPLFNELFYTKLSELIEIHEKSRFYFDWASISLPCSKYTYNDVSSILIMVDWVYKIIDAPGYNQKTYKERLEYLLNIYLGLDEDKLTTLIHAYFDQKENKYEFNNRSRVKLVRLRNELLHGNIDIEKAKIHNDDLLALKAVLYAVIMKYMGICGEDALIMGGVMTMRRWVNLQTWLKCRT